MSRFARKSNRWTPVWLLSSFVIAAVVIGVMPMPRWSHLDGFLSIGTRTVNMSHGSPSSAHHLQRAGYSQLECEGSWRLPRRQQRFCRAYDGATLIARSRLRRLRMPQSSESLLCDSTSPLAIRNCTFENCGTLQDCIMAVASPHCPTPTVVLPFRTMGHALTAYPRIERFESIAEAVFPLSDTSRATHAGFPEETIRKCADFAMRSYCNEAFQLLPVLNHSCLSGNFKACSDRREMVRCVVYRPPYYPMGRPEPVKSQPLFSFLHRSEWRHSLLRDDLRIVIIEAPFRVWLVDDPSAANVHLKLSLRGGFGELVPLNVQAEVVVTLTVLHCPADSEIDGLHLKFPMMLGERRKLWVSPERGNSLSLDPSAGEIDIAWDGIDLSLWIGCSVAFKVAIPKMTGVVPRHVESIVLYRSQHLVLQDSGGRGARVDNRSCAPMMQPDECCLPGIVARHWSESGQTRAASSEVFRDKLLQIVVAEPHPCFDIVDGYVSSMARSGEASFPNLVLRNRCTRNGSSDATASPALILDLLLGQPERKSALRPQTQLRIDAASIVEWCGRGTDKVLPRGFIERQSPEDDPILVSAGVHGSLPALTSLLENIRVMVPNSVVVLHVAPVWKIDLREIYALNGTAHPMLFVNPLRDGLSQLKHSFLQLYNARYMATVHPHVRWSHVVMMASNEVFVRRGIGSYVSQFDLSTPDRPSLGSTMVVKHSFVGGRPELQYVDPEDYDLTFEYFVSFGRTGGLKGDFRFMRLMQTLGLHKVSVVQRYTEGSYFRRDIAVHLAQLLHTFFDAPSECLDGWTTHGEAFLYQILQRSCTAGNSSLERTHRRYMARFSAITVDELPPDFDANATATLMALVEHGRCGEKTGTVMWQNEEWTATEADVRAVRCTPFATPFSIKRVPRDPNADVWQHLKQLQSDPAQCSLLRETSNAYCGTYLPLGHW